MTPNSPTGDTSLDADPIDPIDADPIDAAVIGLGFDVGGTKVLLVATTAEGEEVAVVRGSSPPIATELPHVLTPLLQELLAALGERVSAIDGLGISLPGLIDRSGVLHAAPNLGTPDTALDLRSSLAAPLAALAPGRLDASRVVFENDASAAAFAEATRGAARGARDVLVVSLGTGIGSGIVSDGRVLHGAHGYAGELGHMIIDPDGPECPCGRRGCFERFASGSGLAWLARRAGLSDAADSTLRGEDIVGRARDGNAAALAVIDELAHYLALGLSNAVEILDPGIIVLGGGLMAAADVLLEPTRSAFIRLCRPAQRRRGEDLVIADLGEDAAAIGAALLGLEWANA